MKRRIKGLLPRRPYALASLPPPPRSGGLSSDLLPLLGGDTFPPGLSTLLAPLATEGYRMRILSFGHDKAIIPLRDSACKMGLTMQERSCILSMTVNR